jgi:hypothetical protein
MFERAATTSSSPFFFARFTDSSVGNKVIFKSFTRMPVVKEVDGILSVTAGDSCAGTAAGTSAASMLTSSLGFAVPMLCGLGAGLSATTVATAAALGGFLANAPSALAQTAECEIVPIEVEIYTNTTSDEIVMLEVKGGDYDECPPESLYWKHHPDVYGGYEGCVGEKFYYPCPQDSQGLEEEGGDVLRAKYPIAWDGTSCISTGYATENRTYWILWGDPLDKHELNARTG